jgi:HEAT repeat protein
MASMTITHRGQTNLTTVLALIGLIVAAVWGWKRLSPDTQDYLVERAVPVALVALATAIVMWVIVRSMRQRRARIQRRNRLIARFEAESSVEKRRELAFEMIEVNRYSGDGLEAISPALVEVLIATMKTAVGDKQHRIRGMAASYLGVLQDKQVIPTLLKALEDDHAHVRACAALGLGRLQALEAKEKLAVVMKEDWDQTVRSRAREAWERMA